MVKSMMITVIVPCRNEEDYIVKCLDSIVRCDYSKDSMEVLIVDGESNDCTREIAQEYCKNYPYMRLLRNERKIQSAALNLGIRESRGDIIFRMDAHNTYAEDYISKCLRYLNQYDVDNVGGVCITLPGKESLLANSIAIGLAHPFGVGNSYFRIGAKEPRFVDTVPFGCFRRDVFDRVGYFDEELVRNQDDEFNLRIIKNGGKILLAPDIVSNYYARDSIAKLSRMYYQYGYFKPLVVRKIGAVLTVRQLIPSIFIVTLILTGLLSLSFPSFIWAFTAAGGMYMLSIVSFSAAVAKNKGLQYIVSMPLVFVTLHVSYGAGYLKGLLDFYILGKQMKKSIKDVPITR